MKKQRKGNLEKAAEIFTGQDLNSVKEHLIKDVLFPNIQKLLYDTITNGADTIIYGGKGKNKRSDGTRGSITSKIYCLKKNRMRKLY